MNIHERARALVSVASLPGDGPSLISALRQCVAGWRLLSEAGVPRRHIYDLYGPNMRATDATNAIEAGEFHLSTGGLIVLSGPVGTGKSLAAARAVMARAPLKRLGVPRWVSCSMLASLGWDALQRLAVVAGAHVDAQERTRHKNPVLCRAMVIDDVGAPGSTSGKAQEVTTSIISARHAVGWWTVVTTNLDANGVAELYGSRTVDRLREAGRWVDLKGASLRREQAPLEGDPPRVARAKTVVEAYDRLDAVLRAGTLEESGPLSEAHAKLVGTLSASLGRFLRLSREDLDAHLRTDRERARAQHEQLAALVGKLGEA